MSVVLKRKLNRRLHSSFKLSIQTRGGPRHDDLVWLNYNINLLGYIRFIIR